MGATQLMSDREQEKREYLKRHLWYELLMLRYTHSRINTLLPQLSWNAHFESFGLHARIFYGFLSNDENSATFKAKDFVEAYQKPVKGRIAHIVERVNTQITHLGKQRGKQEQLDVSFANVLYDWIERALPTFTHAIRPEYRDFWKPDTARPPGDPSLSPATGPITHARPIAPTRTTSDSEVYSVGFFTPDV